MSCVLQFDEFPSKSGDGNSLFLVGCGFEEARFRDADADTDGGYLKSGYVRRRWVTGETQWGRGRGDE